MPAVRPPYDSEDAPLTKRGWLDPFRPAAAQGAGRRRLVVTAVLLLLLLLALLCRMLVAYHLESGRGLIVTHVGGMLEYFTKFDQGELWGRRPGLGGVDLRMDGSLYYWLHLPIRLLSNPFRGLLVLSFVLEGAALVFWVLWGLARRLPPSLVWLSAFFLVVAGNPNGELLENSQTANLLTVPLVMAIIGAVVSPRARAMLLPGALLGLIFQIHQAYLILAIPLVVLALTCKELRLRRLFFLLLGAGGAYLLALPAIELPDPNLVDDSAGLASAFDLEMLKQVAATNHPAILAWLGLALVVGRRLWKGDAGPAGKVAAVWLVTGWPFMVAAVCLAAPKLPNHGSPVRFGFLGPAEAVLYALALLWIGALCWRVLVRVLGARRRLATPVALAVVLLLTGVAVGTGLATSGDPLRTAMTSGLRGDPASVAPRYGPCCVETLGCGKLRLARTYLRLADTIRATKWGAAREPRFKFHGPADYYLDAIHMMLDTSVWQSEVPDAEGHYRHVLALPCSMKEALPGVAGECGGGLLFVPDVMNVPIRGRPGTGTLGFTVSPSTAARRLFAVTWRSPDDPDPPLPGQSEVHSLSAVGARIRQRAKCDCASDFTSRVSIVELQLAPGQAARLAVSGAASTHALLRVGSLPRRGSLPLDAPPRPPPSIPLSERTDLVEIPVRTGAKLLAVPRTRGYRQTTPGVQPPRDCPTVLRD